MAHYEPPQLFIYDDLSLKIVFITHTSNINTLKLPHKTAVVSSIPGGGRVVKLPVAGRPTIWISVGQGPTALAVGVGGVVWTFLPSSVLSLLFLPRFGRRPDID